ncbi:MAG: hypothetical protein CFE45_08740 [Burkholderiales bacterium PBB5]|nr:MAG: hypothetical protein CFE45_08740 [Burkholderiales bacterium PBB5]
MSGPHATVADLVMSAIRGQQDAQRLIHTICDGCAPADALLEGLRQVRDTGDAERLRGFCREVQKLVERAGASGFPQASEQARHEPGAVIHAR